VMMHGSEPVARLTAFCQNSTVRLVCCACLLRTPAAKQWVG
jgi:hypothetical protein